MAYFTISESIDVPTPPSSNSDRSAYTLPLLSTIDEKTNKPIITLVLPGQSLVGDISYWKRIKSAGGVPGLSKLDSDLLTTTLRTKFPSISNINNEAELTLLEYNKESDQPKAAEPTEAKPNAQPATNTQGPSADAKKPQLKGQADDDSNPNKTNGVDGFGPNDPGQYATIGPDGLEEVTVTGKKDKPEDLEEVVVTAKRPKAEPKYGKPGKRIHNPLAKLPSYTYNLTLYMITPDAYREFIESGRKKIDALSKATPVGEGTAPVEGGAFIVAQSGGINNNSSRAPGMVRDYFIDNLKIKTLTNTKETGAPIAAVTDLSFQITEPYGFSFLTQLKNANEDLKKYSSSTPYKRLNTWWRQFFILGVRFYGYDANGKPVRGGDKVFGEAIDPQGGDALFEQFYDIFISSVKFKVSAQGVTYNISANVPVTQNILGTKRGRVPTGISVQGKTVQDALTGDYGLFTNLNKKEQGKVNTGAQNLPNTFEVVFLGDAEQLIKDASLVTEDDLKKNRYGSTGVSKTKDSNDSKNEVPPDTTSRILTFNHDTSIISAIETIIKKSQFMVNALKTLYANVNQPNVDKKNYEQIEKEAGTLRWFSITSEIKQADWDDKINDWAFKIVYIVQIYDIPSMETPYLSTTRKYYGPHKRYDYWFTGKNTEVIDLDINFEFLYYNSIIGLGEKKNTTATSPSNGGNRETQDSQSPATSGSSPGNTNTTTGNTGLKEDPKTSTSGNSNTGTGTAGDQVPLTPGTMNPGDRTGGLGVNLETQNSVTTYLYDPFAFSTSKLKIIGDPDFLVKDSSTSINSLYNQFYNTDGFTVNANGGQVFIEIGFKEGQDYQNKYGLQKVNENILFMDYPPEVKAICGNRIIYLVTSVNSSFSDGKFEQQLGLLLPIFPGSKSPTSTSPQTTNTPQQPTNQKTTNNNGNQVADDDALQPVTIKSQKRNPDQARIDDLQPVTVTGRRIDVPPTPTAPVPDIYSQGRF